MVWSMPSYYINTYMYVVYIYVNRLPATHHTWSLQTSLSRELLIVVNSSQRAIKRHEIIH